METTGNHYMLPSDEAEEERLNTQHQLLRQLFGPKLIHPDVTFIDGDKVLDCGAGSGAWLLDLAKGGTIPMGVIGYGVDQNPVLFPKNPPSNLRFLTGDITALPADWSDTFLLVNQRLLLSALHKDEWVSAINEIYRVLAPGGWIQLCEVNTWKAGPAIERERSVLRVLYDSGGFFFEPCKEIPSMLHFAGFVDIHTIDKVTTLAGEEGTQHRENTIRVFCATKSQIVFLGERCGIKSEEDFESLVAAMDDEMKNTPDADKQYTYFYAQKPYV
ncbi:S-adenosyl-L-methionine-dependent methyltransferase [Collybia nuda]|uniref:S-adenosyl-L-methionine-dependent methyltransferase n=1 Tax=Collybia nuda TaxID=64659 RepID=A0A9P5XU86_9AGAR|nr:S-adenosyl-L-methionine-dependent methyltransferase [Collybia nuda]